MLQGPKVNYGTLNNILKNNMDKRVKTTFNEDFKTPPHGNIRGAKHYY